MNKIILTLTVLLGICFSAKAQTVNTGADQPRNTNVNVTSYKDGSGNQWVTLTPVTFSSVRKSKVQVTYDDYNAINDPNGVYKGQENRAYDGVRQNKARNINYMDNSVKLPPNTGKIQ